MKKFPCICHLLFTGIILSLLIGCKKDPAPTPPPPISEASIPNKFVWNALHDNYLWVDKIQNLTGAKFLNKDTLNNFLNQYTDPEKLFTDLLYKYQTIDKWSFIVNDVKTIDDWISGVSKTAGYDFMLYRYGSGNNVFGVVRYVLKGSPAFLAGIKRGNIFTKVDNQQINVDNYKTLLFTKDSYSLSMDTIINRTITPLNKTVALTTTVMQENPILMDTVFTVNGAKTGYLVYNGFNADFDIQLNSVFKMFKNEDVTKLILDLRYNGGGSVQTATYLASMIYSTEKNKVFSRCQYNDSLQNYFLENCGGSSLVDFFTDKINATPINCLGLTSLYVITTDNTASASELLINGLKPYLNEISVGTTTTGKYVGSVTLRDWDDQGNVNPDDTWAMQPIVIKISNSQGIGDYVNGLEPDIQAEEDVTLLLPFGSPDETLLKAVLNDMKGLPQKRLVLKSQTMGLAKIAGAKDFKPFSKDMYINKFPHRKIGQIRK